MKTVTERASAYLARMPASISGKGGDAAAFRAAVALVRGFDLSEQEALPLLSRWNANCRPPWREHELRHKLRNAAASAGQPAGYLLEAEWPQGGHSTQSAKTGDNTTKADKSHTTCSSSQHAAKPQTPGKPEACATSPAPAEDRAWLREAWPEFHPLTREDIRTVAELRGIFPDAVDLAHRHEFLKVAEMQGHRCLVITEGTFAQVRRLDGQPLVKADGTRIKARNLSGSQGAFIGQRWLGETTHVLLVEGAVGLIEGLAAMLQVDTPHAWSILAATSASSRFARDAGLLERLRGREVHIIPDADEAGMDAASSWLADLQSAGVYATAHFLPKPCKDLGDVLHLPEAERQPILDGLFTTRK
ncbi:MAG: toprim domain-containing protein [Prosthecobacter sp.]|uniref:hypothetical protein n=1 Tax=Prosthecobacter sp. TaxID=1965333 RepID=UPI0026300EAA|nr:hypothetical protein [Prosthecobacter sp.]MCF7790107.1 toprim domain-containing protein [Prosthecobacter sp.]